MDEGRNYIVVSCQRIIENTTNKQTMVKMKNTNRKCVREHAHTSDKRKYALVCTITGFNN